MGCLDDGAVGIGKTLEIGKDRLRPMASLSFGSDSLIRRGCQKMVIDGFSKTNRRAAAENAGPMTS